MSNTLKSALNVADTLRGFMWQHVSWWPAGTRIGPVVDAGFRMVGLDIRAFDVTLDDGRVYRVRVSDITPEDATPTRVKETT